MEKTHYRKAFNSPYLSSADIVEPTVLTIKYVRLEKDETKKTKDSFNTAHFAEKEIRHGETLKPMILNATNSRTMKELSGSAFIEDWNDIPVQIYVDDKVKFGRDFVDGLRISKNKPRTGKPELVPTNETEWARGIASYRAKGSLEGILKSRVMTQENMDLLINQAKEPENVG